MTDTIFVTGGAGFIGSNFCHYLKSKGLDDVVILDMFSYAANPDNLNGLDYTVKGVDLAERNRVDELFSQYKPKCVFHFAAETHVDNSIKDVTPFISSNVIGTINLLNASVKYEVEGFHHISTDEVYGALKLDDPAFTEQTPYDPQNPYSASKASSDHFVMAYHNTYGLPTVITNCSNNYGPYHFPEKLIPVTILNALAGKPLPLYADGGNIRDWLYVEDHADALLLVLEKGTTGRSYNIGGENECSNLELVTRLCEILDCVSPRSAGSYSELITFVQDRPGHDAMYAIEPSRIRNELGWQPSVTLEEGLEKTVLWYLDNETWWRSLLGRSGVGKRLGTKS